MNLEFLNRPLHLNLCPPRETRALMADTLGFTHFSEATRGNKVGVAPLRGDFRKPISTKHQLSGGYQVVEHVERERVRKPIRSTLHVDVGWPLSEFYKSARESAKRDIRRLENLFVTADFLEIKI